MRLSMISAASENMVIARDGIMPWHLPKDLQYFKDMTIHHPIIMGRKTFQAFGISKPLPQRTNIVLTRRTDYTPKGVFVVQTLEKAIALAKKDQKEEIFIIGGEQIYRLALPLANRIYLTRIHAHLEGDTFFPEIDQNEWKLTSADAHAIDEKHEYAYTFEVWDRSQNEGEKQ